MRLTASARTVQRGRPVTLTATVTNHSRGRRATGVVLALPLPSGAIPGRRPAGCALIGTAVLCRVGELPAGGSVRYRLPLRFGGSGLQAATAMLRGDQVQGPGRARSTVDVRVEP